MKEIVVDKNLTDLRIGEKALIKKIDDSGALNRRIRDLGIIPGQIIILEGRAPFGDPLCVKCQGSTFAIREQEARKIVVEIIVC